MATARSCCLAVPSVVAGRLLGLAALFVETLGVVVIRQWNGSYSVPHIGDIRLDFIHVDALHSFI